MKILVTGATGFVGAVLLPRLIGRYGPGSIAAFVPPGDRIPETWADRGVRVFEGDIADAPSVRAAVAGRTHVVHMAGLISYWRGDRERLYRVNRDGVRAVAEACCEAGVERLVHISSIGAIGFHQDGTPADEETPFNWPSSILYMASKHEGQRVVEDLVRDRSLRAVILNPASIMGPGDHDPRTPHNRLYRMIGKRRVLGSFSGGLAIVDVRDLADVILKALDGKGRDGQKYLVVGGNLRYPDVIRLISRAASGRAAHPVSLPAWLVAAGGGLAEGLSAITGKRPLITYAYGRLSGARAYADNRKSILEFDHAYRPVDQTIADGWEYFRNRHKE